MIDNNKSSVLVLGGSGLLGAHCYDVLQNNYNVITTYNSNPLPYNNSIKFNIYYDMKDLITLLELYKPAMIINTIAMVTVDGCEANPKIAHKMNSTFVKKLVTSIKKANLKTSHLIHISSDSVYGNRINGNYRPWSETDPLNPLSVYAKTKAQSELEAAKHEGPFSILRTAFYGINPFSKKSLLWWIINNAKKGNEMDGWENIYFSPVSVPQLVRVIDYMFNQNITGLYNVGSIDGCNKFDFVDYVCKNICLKPKINRVVSNRKGGQIIRPDYSQLCSDKLSAILPWDVYWKKDLKQYLGNMLPFPKS